MPAKGKFNILNALAAAACAVEFGFSLDEIKYGIENFTPPKMRMETLITKSGATLINDAYNANPSSVKEAIQAVVESYPGKEINLVLGDMLELGSKSVYYHSDIGKFISAQKNINSIYLVGEMSFYAKESIKGRDVVYSKDANIILEKLNQVSATDKSVFLFKASRGIKLEEICMEFYNTLEQRDS
jgi:UDP-N-acetylmuramoyl-tripeptide--D-alanyl-D-alanine ligase